MNRKSNPREHKMKEDLELLSKAVLQQHDVITALTKENESIREDKRELLRRLEIANNQIGRRENQYKELERDIQNLEDFKERAIPMLEAYFALL